MRFLGVGMRRLLRSRGVYLGLEGNSAAWGALEMS